MTHDADSAGTDIPGFEEPADAGTRAGEPDELAPSARPLPRGVRLRVGVGAAVVLVLAAFGVAVAVAVFGAHGDDSTVPAVSASTRAGSEAGGVATPSAHALYVHVVGAVAHPGLYVLQAGARVVDAIAAAGGFAKNAEQRGVNLARSISDGEQLVVPVIGQAPVAAAGGSAGEAGVPSGSGAKVNLNTASETELETLPRIGPSLAGRIIDWRTKNGRFTSVDDLTNVTGIGEKTFDGLKDLVTV